MLMFALYYISPFIFQDKLIIVSKFYLKKKKNSETHPPAVDHHLLTVIPKNKMKNCTKRDATSAHYYKESHRA